VEIDDENLDIQFSKEEGGGPILIANIPVKEVRKAKP
jgi:septum formation topological specificity factor MinE